jgi:hypothetical protein
MKNEDDDTDYASESVLEKKAAERLKELAEEMAEECERTWMWGDGEGGYVFEVIRKAFNKGIEYQTSSEPVRRRKMAAKTRKAVFERDGYRCVKCTSFIDLQIDHVYPHSKGGSDDPENLQTLCAVCNRIKKDKVEEAA